MTSNHPIPPPPRLTRGIPLGRSYFYWISFVEGQIDYNRVKDTFYGRHIGKCLVDDLHEYASDVIWSRIRLRRIFRKIKHSRDHKKIFAKLQSDHSVIPIDLNRVIADYAC